MCAVYLIILCFSKIADYAFVSDDSVQRDDILGMEMRMLKSINFKLGRPLPLHFLRRNSKAGNVSETSKVLKYSR